MEKLLCTPKEAAESTGLGLTKVYELVSAGVWPSVRVGRAVRIPANALRDWIDAHTTGTTVQAQPSAAEGRNT